MTRVTKPLTNTEVIPSKPKNKKSITLTPLIPTPLIPLTPLILY